MRIKTTDNGNITVYNRQDIASHRNSDNSSWLTSNSTESNLRENTTDNSQVTNCNTIYNSIRNTELSENYPASTDICTAGDVLTLSAELVCNRQYRINSRQVNTVQTINNSDTDALEVTTEIVRTPCEGFISTYFTHFFNII